MPTEPAAEIRETVADANVWLDQTLPPAAALRTVVFIGAGLGHAVDALGLREPAARAILLEPDPAVAAALAGRADWAARAAAGRLTVLAGPDYSGAAETARRFPDLHGAPVLVSPALASTRPDDVLRARQALARLAFQSSANDSARRASAGRYLLQTLANGPRLAREADAGALAGLFPGVPAVVVAAGPSLDRNIHDLALVRDAAIVIACDTAARTLISVGLEPDFIVASDSSRANAAHLSSLPASRSWLVGEGSLHPSAFTHFDRHTFAFRLADHEPWPWLRTLGLDRAILPTWGSVATSGFSLAASIGADPIVFMGADFAFTDGRPYCRGTSFEPQWANWVAGGATYDAVWQQLVDRWPEVTETDLNGDLTRTAPHLVSFRDWVVEHASQSDRRIVNATGAGLLAGSRIEQASAAAVLSGAVPLDRRQVHERISRQHAATRGDLGRLLHGVTAILATPAAAEYERWIAFAQSTITPAAIEAILSSPEHAAWLLAWRETLAAARTAQR